MNPVQVVKEQVQKMALSLLHVQIVMVRDVLGTNKTRYLVLQFVRLSVELVLELVKRLKKDVPNVVERVIKKYLNKFL